MPTQIKLPSLGENIESGDVLQIFVSEGDVVKKDQDLLELETDKATMPVPSPSAGKITKVLVAEGDTVPVGGAIFEIEADGDGGDEDEAPKKSKPAKTKDEPAEKKEKKKPAPEPEEEEDAEGPDDDGPLPDDEAVEEALVEDEEVAELQEEPEQDAAKAKKGKSSKSQDEKKSKKVPPPPPESTPLIVEDDEPGEDPLQRSGSPQKTAAKKKSAGDVPGDGRAAAAAGPAVRRLARELGVELRRVRPSGDGGRITEEDVRNHVRKSQAESAAKAPKGVTPPGAPDTDDHGAVRREKMSRMRQTIARNMLASYTQIPQLTNFDDVDVTELEHIRKESQKDYDSQGVKLTTMPFLIKACAVALRQHPIVNASVSDDGAEIIYKEYVNIGVAVDTERGLVVPVLRDADRKNIPQIARELSQLAELARDGKYTIEDLRGGTFTISNLGAIGGTYSTPIINPPEAAILLVGRSRMAPLWVDNAFQPRLMMPLSITYDHRIVDGAAAARFLNDVKGYLANPGRLLLAP
jgi:pyruvate dehydrogenase E2 component (dihydrolipoamide acetyltransferase)